MSQIIEYLSDVATIKVKSAILDKMAQYWKSETTLEVVRENFAEAEAGGDAGLNFLKKVSVYGKGVFKTGAQFLFGGIRCIMIEYFCVEIE